MNRTVRLLLITIALLLCSSCAGSLVRATTWSQDPTPFWVVIKEDGDCSVVWGSVLIQGTQDSRIEILSDTDLSIGCESTIGYHFERTSADATLLPSRFESPDLSTPKASRSGPRVLSSTLLAEKDRSYLSRGFPVYFQLAGTRLGQSPVCSRIEVKVTSLTLILNAGIEHDLHVFIGKGDRQCRVI